jgi:hypothetical protein
MANIKTSLMKRCVIIFLSILLTFSAVSCGAKTTQKQVEATSAEIADITSGAEESSEPVRPNLPSRDWGGADFTIMEREDDSSGWWGSTDVYTEELNGDSLNDALYNRNAAVESWFNISIKPYTVADGNFVTTLNKSIAAGDNSCDLAMLTLATAFTSAQNGYLYALNDSEYINMDASYYTQSIFKDTSVFNRNYFAVGDMTIISSDGTWILMFNKVVAENQHIDDLYQLVRDGSWTTDKFYSLIKENSGDSNGDSVYDELDNYGFATSGNSYSGFFYGMGGSIISKDADDGLTLTGINEQVVDIVEKANQIMSDKTITFNNDNFPSVGWQGIQVMFEAGQVLFYGEVLQCVTRLRAMDTDFGVLPFPKYNDAQATYTSYINSWASDALTIPRCTPDKERSEIVFEALSYESEVYLKPTYYDIALKSKAMRDDESGEMLDIILSGRKVDIGYLSNVGNVSSFIVGQMSKSSGKVASNYAKIEKSSIKSLDKMIESFKLLSEND